MSSPPGDTIKDLLEERCISVDYFAELMRMSSSDAQSLLAGRSLLTKEIAEMLSILFTGTQSQTDFWIAREKNYRDDINRSVYRTNLKHFKANNDK